MLTIHLHNERTKLNCVAEFRIQQTITAKSKHTHNGTFGMFLSRYGLPASCKVGAEFKSQLTVQTCDQAVKAEQRCVFGLTSKLQDHPIPATTEALDQVKCEPGYELLPS